MDATAALSAPPTATDATAPFVDSHHADHAVTLAADNALVEALVADMEVDLAMQAMLDDIATSDDWS